MKKAKKKTKKVVKKKTKKKILYMETEECHYNVFALMVKERIATLMKKKNVNSTQLARKLKKTKSWVSQLLSLDTNRNLTLKTVHSIYRVLDEELDIISYNELKEMKKDRVMKVESKGYKSSLNEAENEVLQGSLQKAFQEALQEVVRNQSSEKFSIKPFRNQYKRVLYEQ